MAKSKRSGPPLFELLQGNRFRRGDVSPPPDLRVVHHEPDATYTEDDLIQAPSSIRIVQQAEPVPVRNGKHPALQFLGDRLHVSLTPFTAAIGVFAISLVVLGAVFVGQKRGEKAGLLRAASGLANPNETGTVEAVETVREQPPASHLVESLLDNRQESARGTERQSRKNPAAAPAPAPAELPAGPQQGWVRDFTYIVTQEFAAGRDQDALRAQEFLTARGFPAQVVKQESGALQLITLEGYNHKDPAQKKKADEILKKQRAIGTEYFASGGGYKLEGYYKTLKKDQW